MILWVFDPHLPSKIIAGGVQESKLGNTVFTWLQAKTPNFQFVNSAATSWKIKPKPSALS